MSLGHWGKAYLSEQGCSPQIRQILKEMIDSHVQPQCQQLSIAFSLRELASGLSVHHRGHVGNLLSNCSGEIDTFGWELSRSLKWNLDSILNIQEKKLWYVWTVFPYLCYSCFICISVLSAYVCVLCACLEQAMSEEVLDSPGIRVMGGRYLPHGWWELNSGPLQEQPVFLLAAPPFQALCPFLSFTVIWLEPRVSSMLDKYSTSELHPRPGCTTFL